MEKKFDFKTIAIACLLFFCFVFLLFYKFSSADDSLTHYKTALEIFDSQQSFDDFKATLPDKILPDDYTESESMVNMLYTLACFCMGDYIGVGEGLVTELSGQITGDPLFLQHFVFDYDSLCWVFDSDTDDFIKSALESSIYEVPSGDYVVGAWRSLPYQLSGWGSYYKFTEVSSNTAPVYVTMLTNGQYVFGSFVSGQVVYYPANSLNSYIYVSNTFQGSESLGYYGTYDFYNSSDMANWSNPYTNLNAALGDLFGVWDSEPSLIDGVTIRNEDFTVKPLSYPASVLVDYPKEITYPDYDPDDTRLTFEYTYNMEVPFWLKNSTTEPISYELPTDYDFGNIEFEYDADPSYLAGAGIVQDVFEVLPASLQGLILLFGAGSLAFIFLRR